MAKKSHRKNNDQRNKYKCRCGRGYMVEWAYKNHIKHCIDGK